MSQTSPLANIQDLSDDVFLDKLHNLFNTVFVHSGPITESHLTQIILYAKDLERRIQGRRWWTKKPSVYYEQIETLADLSARPDIKTTITGTRTRLKQYVNTSKEILPLFTF